MGNEMRCTVDPRRFGWSWRRATTGGAFARAYRSILLAAAAAPLLQGGCGSTPPTASTADGRPQAAATAPPAAPSVPEAAGAGAPTPVVDDGARIVANRLLQAIGTAGDPPPKGAVVSLGGLKNRSVASEAEFNAFRTRLAALLGAALAPAGLEVVPDAGASPAFVIGGSADLDMFRGFNAWELQLTLMRSSDQRSLWTADGWTADGPVRVLRSPPPAGVQVFPPRSWLDARAAPALWQASDQGTR